MELHNTEKVRLGSCDRGESVAPMQSTQLPMGLLTSASGSLIAHQRVQEAVVIFSDLTGFQPLSKKYGDITCTNVVQTLFGKFDNVAHSLGVTPLKTNGDQYIAVCLPENKDLFSIRSLVVRAIKFSVMLRNIVSCNAMLVSSSCFLRVGVATGTVISGYPARPNTGFDIWGNTVNRAAMLEQYTAPNTIAICEDSFNLFYSRGLETKNATTIEDVYSKSQHDGYDYGITFQSIQLKTKVAVIRAFIG